MASAAVRPSSMTHRGLTYLITGANRGIGLEFTRQLATRDASSTIISTIRDTSSVSEGLGSLSSSHENVHLATCELADPVSISSLASQVERILGSPSGTSSSRTTVNGDSAKIDVLINNAATNLLPTSTPLTIEPESFQSEMATNVLGPALVVSSLLPMLGSGSLVVNLTTGLGSTSRTLSASWGTKATLYSVSKAALNVLSVHQAKDPHLRGKGVTVVGLDPGWVITELGGEGANVDVEDSVSGMLRVLDELMGKGQDVNGKCFNWKGAETSW